MRYVTRNPFAHESIYSERITVNSDTSCAFCGSLRYRKHPCAKNYLLRFIVEGDSHTHIIPRLFCSRSCAEAFHNVRFGG